MRRAFTILLLFSISFGLLAQTNDLTVYSQDELDQKAFLNIGDSSLKNYFYDHFAIPEKAFKDGVHGKVIITFVVEKNGKLSSVYCISEPLKYGIEELAIETIKKSSGFWRAGIKNSNKVRSKTSFDFEIVSKDEIIKNEESSRIKRKNKKYKPKGRARWHYKKKIRAQKKSIRKKKRKKRRRDRLIRKGKMTITPHF